MPLISGHSQKPILSTEGTAHRQLHSVLGLRSNPRGFRERAVIARTCRVSTGPKPAVDLLAVNHLLAMVDDLLDLLGSRAFAVTHGFLRVDQLRHQQ
jgi:hypothetical protein